MGRMSLKLSFFFLQTSCRLYIFREGKNPVKRVVLNLATAQVDEYSEDQFAMVKIPNMFR